VNCTISFCQQSFPLSFTVLKQSLLQHIVFNVSDTDAVIRHVHYGDSVVAVYIGSDFHKSDFANGILEDFISGVQKYGIGKSLQTQHCGKNNTASSVFGIIADTSSGTEAFSRVRQAVRAWSKGQCADILTSIGPFKTLHTPPSMRSTTQDKSVIATNQTSKWIRVGSQESNQTENLPILGLVPKNQLALFAPNECSMIQAASGDSCGKLIDKCAAAGHRLTGNELER
jgi:hypothetical protein